MGQGWPEQLALPELPRAPRRAGERRYEVRDPIHGFIGFDPLEKQILDSAPVQRLRGIKQLALTNQLYPGAAHTRLEHALGVMELAGRAFDAIRTSAGDDFRDWMGWQRPGAAGRQRRVLRLAALLHDVGHAPFSHAAEELFPPELPGHEHFTRAILEHPAGEIATILATSEHNAHGITPADITPIACERSVVRPRNFQEALLASLISGALGVDRMDYLVRDSHHTGVAYGRFDHLRLLNTLRVTRPGAGIEPQLAIEAGGLHAAEGLLLARHFMHLQVYQHPVRQIYDVHLVDFLRAWLPGLSVPSSHSSHSSHSTPTSPAGLPNPPGAAGGLGAAGTAGPAETAAATFPTDLPTYLRLDDARVETAFHDVAAAPNGGPLATLAPLASRLSGRGHFRLAARVSAHQRSRTDLQLDLFEVLRAELPAHFGPDAVRATEMRVSTSDLVDVPIVDDEGSPVPEDRVPRLFASVGEFWEGRIFCRPGDPALREKVARWVQDWLARHTTA